MRNLILIATLILSACGGHVGEPGECVLQPKEHVDAPQWAVYTCEGDAVPTDEFTCVQATEMNGTATWYCDRPGTGSVLNYRPGT